VNESGDGGGERRPRSDSDDTSLVRHEEHARVDKQPEELGALRARREVVREQVQADYPRQTERLHSERVAVGEGDSGKIETLPDGSVSIPLFEEELVVTRKTVLRERVIIRKESVTETQTVKAELRKEQVHFDTDDPEGNHPRRQQTRRRQHAATEPTKADLYQQAKQLGIEGRSKLTKAELERAVAGRGGAVSTNREPKASPFDVQKFLDGVGYPIRKRQLLREAEMRGASRDVRATLRRLPDKQFDAPTEVSEEIGKLE
jgi:uncharacterized protein (TIGR02271 family)